MRKVRYGLHWFYLGDDMRLKVDHPKYEFLSVRVLYTVGGWDKLRCENDARGYYLSVIPVEGAEGRFRSGPSDGAKIILNAVGHRSEKGDAVAIEKGKAMIPSVIAEVCAKIGAKYSLSDLKSY